ncbi:MAG: 4-vinyl reductase [Desulfobacterales bacterium]|nr:MAG: 4-vinyl reductase [Desulfobacterales bacterium]
MVPSLKFDPDNNIIEFNGSLISLHCHHYNFGLLKTIEEIPLVDGHAVIIETAAEEFFVNFRRHLSKELKSVSTDKAFQEASELYRFMGFGRLDLSGLTARGGIAFADSSYYVTAWLGKYGRRETPVCYFTCGFIAGILGAVFDVSPHTYEVTETRCIIERHERCKFVVSKKRNGD